MSYEPACCIENAILWLPSPPERSKNKVRLAYLVSHPIQYQAPLLRRIAQEPDIDLTVFFGSDFSVRGYQDEGFGVDVKWDVPLLDGYRYEFLPALRDNGTQTVTTPLNHGILSRLRGQGGSPPFDVLWVHGYAMVNAIAWNACGEVLGIPVLLRGDMWLKDRPRSGTKLAAEEAFSSGFEEAGRWGFAGRDDECGVLASLFW